MLEAIASAEHHVHLETYILADDEVGRRFAGAVAAKAREGVTVRLLYDSIGSRDVSAEVWDELQTAGVNVRTFNPPDPIEDQNPFDIATRDHRKLLIVDGRVAFTGGINIDRNYARPSDAVGGKSAQSGWRDTHIRVAGPAVAGPDFNSPSPRAEDLAASPAPSEIGPLDDVVFATNSTQPTESAFAQLDTAARWLKKHPRQKVHFNLFAEEWHRRKTTRPG
jgi:hypothetical protein